jgi:arylsulfatase
VFWPYGAPVPETVAVNVRNRTHAAAAEVDVGDGLPEGIMLAMGTRLGGWTFHVLDGRLRYVHSYLGRDQYVVESTEPVVRGLEPGRHVLGFTFASNGDFSGRLRLSVDGVAVGEGDIPRVTPVRYSITGGGLTCGWEMGPAVGDGYQAPFRFAGGLVRVLVTVDGAPHEDPEGQFAAIMAEQ